MPWESELCSLCISLGALHTWSQAGALCPRYTGCYSCLGTTVLLTYRLKGKSIENLKMVTAGVAGTKPVAPQVPSFSSFLMAPIGLRSPPLLLLSFLGSNLMVRFCCYPMLLQVVQPLLVRAWVLVLLELLCEPFLLTPHWPVNPSEYISCVQGVTVT